MKTVNTLLLLSVLLASPALAFADDFSNLYSNPYSNPYGSTYPDGSSRPLNPGPGGRWNDDEYNSRQRTQQSQQPRSHAVEPAPTAPTHDFNVWKDGKPTLCTSTKHDVYCY